MATNGQDVSKGDTHAASGASAPASASSSTGKPGKARSGNGPEKTEAEIYHERVGCGLFWAVGKFRPTNYMIVSPFASLQQYCVVLSRAKVNAS